MRIGLGARTHVVPLPGIAYSLAQTSFLGLQNDNPPLLAQAEYKGVANTVAELTWIRNLLIELHLPITNASVVYCDNISSVYLSTNPVKHQRTKHIELDIHFVRDKVAIGEVKVLHASLQYADIFTKGLPCSLHKEFRTSLTVCKPTM